MINSLLSDRTTHRITTDQEAIDITQHLTEEFAKGSAERDRDRRLPYAELEQLSQSGLLGITIPKEYGGAYVSNVTLATVIKILSEGATQPRLCSEIADTPYTDSDSRRLCTV